MAVLPSGKVSQQQLILETNKVVAFLPDLSNALTWLFFQSI